MKRSNEKGAALIFALIFVLVLSTLATSLMFLSQSETWSSLNYRLMTESRYGAEAGLHKGANYLLSSNYSGPGAMNQYNLGVSPVTYSSGPAALGATLNGVSQNFPLQNTFPSNGSLQAGNNTVNYAVQAELLSLKQINSLQCGNIAPQTLTTQLWKLTSHGDISGVRNSEVEVSALLESHVTPCYSYAGFATGNGLPTPCGLITFKGGGTISSYDSSAPLTNGAPVIQQYDGNLGANGNVNTANNTVINGTFASPDPGVGGCAAGTVTAVSGAGQITGCVTGTTNCGTPIVPLPQTVSYPPPTNIPSVVPPPAQNISGSGSLSPCTANCPGNGNNNGNYGDISSTGGTITFNPGGTNPQTCVPGIYYVNSITLSGQGQIQVAPCPGTGTGPNNPAVYQPVIINVVGAAPYNSAPITLTGQGFVNPSYDASIMQIEYAGTGAVKIAGNGAASGVIYAPNAPVTLAGNGAIYGSVIGASLTDNGNPVTINYDRQLANKLLVPGNWTLDTFTWSKF